MTLELWRRWKCDFCGARVLEAREDVEVDEVPHVVVTRSLLPAGVAMPPAGVTEIRLDVCGDCAVGVNRGLTAVTVAGPHQADPAPALTAHGGPDVR